MKLRILFLSLLFPFMALSQYYVGRLNNYNSREYYSAENLKTAINGDGSMYIFYGSKISKILPSGLIDSSFGIGGIVDVGVYSSYGTNIFANDQGIYLLLVNKIAKYSLTGTPDMSFGVNGIVTYSQSISKIFLNSDSSLYFSSNKEIKKILPNGQIDNSFAISVPANDFYFINNDFYVFRLEYPSFLYVTKHDLNGGQDLTYGNLGTFTGLNHYIIDTTSGNIYANNSTGITRYTSAGVEDSTFGTGGTVLGNFPGSIKSVKIDSNNNILFFGGGQAYGYNQTVIYRLKNNGDLDNTFNNGNYKYVSDHGIILNASLIDDNTYVCVDNRRYSLNSFVDRTKKYVRTQDQSIITVDQNLNLNEVRNNKTDNIKVYPNPTTEVLYVKVENNEKVNRINVYTMTGDFILSTNKTEINVKHLTTGNYVIEVVTKHKNYKTKFVKK
ncbi:T9SS type A sorting domain-containing protein [Chryseobacterium indologenes]|uniref:T9SS type A sorting domain-containing protein n=1 Tax=Chryseobacterium indologenes TaxID=253 RepID=UPI0004B1861D|nr:T9SS type A sorting domain-containing protein [Chryseobacterium indologenes]